MAGKMKKSLREGFDRLKKALKKALTPGNENAVPQLILQPYRNKPGFRQ